MPIVFTVCMKPWHQNKEATPHYRHSITWKWLKTSRSCESRAHSTAFINSRKACLKPLNKSPSLAGSNIYIAQQLNQECVQNTTVTIVASHKWWQSRWCSLSKASQKSRHDPVKFGRYKSRNVYFLRWQDKYRRRVLNLFSQFSLNVSVFPLQKNVNSTVDLTTSALLC